MLTREKKLSGCPQVVSPLIHTWSYPCPLVCILSFVLSWELWLLHSCPHLLISVFSSPQILYWKSLRRLLEQKLLYFFSSFLECFALNMCLDVYHLRVKGMLEIQITFPIWGSTESSTQQKKWGLIIWDLFLLCQPTQSLQKLNKESTMPFIGQKAIPGTTKKQCSRVDKVCTRNIGAVQWVMKKRNVSFMVIETTMITLRKTSNISESNEEVNRNNW